MTFWRRVCSLTATCFAIAALTIVSCGGDSHEGTGDEGSRVASSQCGPPIVKPTGEQWQCTFADDFSGDELDESRWVARNIAPSYVAGPACYLENGDNAAVSGGTLKLSVTKEAAPSLCGSRLVGFPIVHTGGVVTTWRRFSQTYGRFEVRAKFPTPGARGLHSALWLYPETETYGPWPLSGEIDIAEAYSRSPDRVYPAVHYLSALPDPNATSDDCIVRGIDEFHTYAVEWTPSTITFIYDEEICLVNDWEATLPANGSGPFDQPFFIVLTQGLSRLGQNEFDPATTPLPATMEVDYVRVWK